MKIIGVIPARYQSSRLPGKPLADICGKPMIQWVYENTVKSGLFDRIYVATDDQRIFDCVKGFAGEPLMTSTTHRCGTDRLAECVDILSLTDEDIIFNIQGDEPLISTQALLDLYSAFEDKTVYMASLKKRIEKKDELMNPNVVKVITDINHDAIYFSRFCLPYERNGQSTKHFKHIGLYGYKVWFLKKFSKLPPTELEIAESLEQLRVIENGYKIRIRETNYQTIGVDTPEQLKQVEGVISKKKVCE